MSKKTEADLKLKVTWLQEDEERMERTSAGSALMHTEVRDGAVVFDPFVVTEKVPTIDTGVDRIKELWESGKISDEEAIAASRRAERVNRSQGRDILKDNRMLVPNRINRYVEWAVSQGQDAEEARKYALGVILEQAQKQKGFGGHARGGVSREVNLLDRKEA